MIIGTWQNPEATVAPSGDGELEVLPGLEVGLGGPAQIPLALALIGLTWWLMTRLVLPRLPRREPAAPLLRRPGHLFIPLALYFVGAVVIGGLLPIMGYKKPEEVPAIAMFALTAALLGIIVMGIVFLVRQLDGDPEHVGLGDPKPLRSFTAGLLIYVACFPAFFGAQMLWLMTLDALGSPPEMQDVAKMLADSEGLPSVIMFLFAAALIPFLEEFIFRGFLQNWLVALRSPRFGILATSFIFAGLHGVSPFGFLFLVALAAGVALYRTGSLWAAVGVHAATNLVSSIMLLGT